jgi:hypothetical protein
MRNIVCVVVVIMATSVLCDPDAATDAPRQLSVRLEAPKTTFKKYELFSIYLFVVNQESDRVRAPSRRMLQL